MHRGQSLFHLLSYNYNNILPPLQDLYIYECPSLGMLIDWMFVALCVVHTNDERKCENRQACTTYTEPLQQFALWRLLFPVEHLPTMFS